MGVQLNKLLDDEQVVYRIFRRFWEVYPNLLRRISDEDMTLVNITKAEIEKDARIQARKEGYDEGLRKCDEIITKMFEKKRGKE